MTNKTLVALGAAFLLNFFGNWHFASEYNRIRENFLDECNGLRDEIVERYDPNKTSGAMSPLELSEIYSKMESAKVQADNFNEKSHRSVERVFLFGYYLDIRDHYLNKDN